MREVLAMTKLGTGETPSRNVVTQDMQQEATSLLPQAVKQAKIIMQKHCDAYKERMNPNIDEELDKLNELYEKHKFYQLSLFDDERRKTERERWVDKTFDNFVSWVKDTLEIENNPYIRIVASMMGGN
jgi:uncharacterized protein YnzC (UPF0291/DUF896 family)